MSQIKILRGKIEEPDSTTIKTEEAFHERHTKFITHDVQL